jgi:hypothetical protein
VRKVDPGVATIVASIILGSAAVIGALINNPTIFSASFIVLFLTFALLIFLWRRDGTDLLGMIYFQFFILIMISAIFISLSKKPPTHSPEDDRDNRPERVTNNTLLELKIQGSVENKYYYIFAHPSENNLVEGQVGSYYRVRLKDANNQRTWLFRNEEYTISAFDEDFGVSVNRFNRDLIYPLEAEGIDYHLYVRGEADRDDDNDFKEEILPLHNYEIVSYLPSAGRGTYRPDFEEHLISQEFTNEDLPFLRAEFLRRTLLRTYSLNSDVLEGEVTNEVRDEDRQATVYLFINWTNS